MFAGMKGDIMKAGTLRRQMGSCQPVFFLAELMLAGAKSRLYLPDTQTGVVITDIMAIGYAGKRNTVLRSRYICWWWDMIGESAMLVKVDDD